MGLQRVRHDLVTEQQNLIKVMFKCLIDFLWVHTHL